ncbi:MAG: hypothetical protein PF508_01180 [Spirochaeta sp.]|jgi:hypothetical protein|nr:hypothetical protein [Spirochaeta sp.]
MNDKMEHSIPASYDDDTISLIDLLAVTIRYRIVILGGTILVFIVALAVVYGMPALGITFDEDVERFRVEQKFQVQALSPEVRNYVDVNLMTAFLDVMTDPLILQGPYRNLLGDDDDQRSPEQLATFLTNDFIGNSFTVSADAASGVVTVTLTTDDTEVARVFLGAIVERARQELSVRVEPQLARAQMTIATALDTTTNSIDQLLIQRIGEAGTVDDPAVIASILTNVSTSGAGLLMELYDLNYVRNQILNIKGNAGTLIAPINQAIVYALPDSDNPRMVIVIATITAFFLTVFLAFVLEYMRRVRNDPEEMGKLRAAWRREDV